MSACGNRRTESEDRDIRPFERPGIHPEVDPAKFRSEFCTDMNTARLFAKENGPFVRWVPGWGWLFFQGGRWQRDKTGEVKAMMAAVSDWFRHKALGYSDPTIAKHLYSHARYVESAKGIKACMECGQRLCSAAEDDFDAYPWLVNCRNATLDLESITGDLPQFHDHSSADMLTRIIPHDWHLEAKAPRWIQFLKEIFPSQDIRDFIQRAVGYSLTGFTGEQCFMICHGTGANGKSVFLNTLRRVLGSCYAKQADPRSFTTDVRGDAIRNDLAMLQGVRFVSAIETGEGRTLDETLVKTATGGDPIVARFLYKETFQYVPQFKLWLATNHKPRVRGTDYAIWRRIRLIPFNETIPEADRDPHLESKLEREAEGILAWAVEGAVRYRKEGLRPPAEVNGATEQYRHDEDLVGQFLEDCAEQEPHAHVAKAVLYERYKRWCDDEGLRAMSQKRLGQRLAEMGFDDFRDHKARFWIGLRVES